MYVASSHESAARRAELDPFDLQPTEVATKSPPARGVREARAQAEAEFGCVDWYLYNQSMHEVKTRH